MLGVLFCFFFFFFFWGGVEAFIDWAILLNDGVTWAIHLMLDGGL